LLSVRVLLGIFVFFDPSGTLSGSLGELLGGTFSLGAPLGLGLGLGSPLGELLAAGRVGVLLVLGTTDWVGEGEGSPPSKR